MGGWGAIIEPGIGFHLGYGTVIYRDARKEDGGLVGILIHVPGVKRDPRSFTSDKDGGGTARDSGVGTHVDLRQGKSIENGVIEEFAFGGPLRDAVHVVYPTFIAMRYHAKHAVME